MTNCLKRLFLSTLIMEWLQRKPEVIFTHDGDLDGFVSGLLLKELVEKLFGEGVPLEPVTIQGWRTRKNSERVAWASDLTPNMKNDIEGWVIIDHHPIRYQPERALLIHDINRCSSAIVYEICKQHGIYSEAYERLVHLSNVADLFLVDDPSFHEALDYSALVKTYQFRNLYRLTDGRLERILGHPFVKVMATKRVVEDPIGLEWSRNHIIPVTEQLAYVEIIVGNPNVILHTLLDDPTVPYPILMTLWVRSSAGIIASFRSRQGEALKLAEMLQGGGHPNAAAATLPVSVRSVQEAIEYIRNIIKQQEQNTIVLQTTPEQALADLFSGWDDSHAQAE